MKNTSLSIVIIGASVLWSGAVLASDLSVVSEAAPGQQEEMKSEGQATMSDMQSSQSTSRETNQGSEQTQPEPPAPADQDQAPSPSNPPTN